MWETIWQLFISFYNNPGGLGIGAALVLGAIWLGAFAPPVHKRPWLWAVLAGGAILFGPTVAFIQVPLQLLADQALLRFWPEATLQHVLLVGIPALVLAGLVQEGLKLLPPLIYLRRRRPLSKRDALILGAVAGVGFGIFEAVGLLGPIFTSGFTWTTVQTQGWLALLPFWERFSFIGFHAGATALAIYGWNKGKGWQFYLLVAALHIIVNYGAILFAAELLTAVQVEIYTSALAVAVLIPAFRLRWQGRGEAVIAQDEFPKVKETITTRDKPSKIYARIPNINLLPREEKHPLLSRLQTYLVIAMVVVLAITMTVYHSNQVNRAEAARLQAELDRVKTEISALVPDASYLESLRQEINTLEQELNNVQTGSETITSMQTLGERPVAIIFEALPPELVLRSITQDNLAFSVVGFSPDARESVEQYRQQLLSYPEVSNAFLWTVLYSQATEEGAYSFNLLINFAGGEE